MRELSDILKVEFVTLSVVIESRSETISPRFVSSEWFVYSDSGSYVLRNYSSRPYAKYLLSMLSSNLLYSPID